MPFGIKDPSSYTRDDREVIYAESYDSCPICNQELPVREGFKSVAPVLIPQKPLADHNNIVAFGCSACYVAQNRLNFLSLKALQDHRESKMSSRISKDRIARPVGRPRKSESAEVIVKQPAVGKSVGRPRKNAELFESLKTNPHLTNRNIESLLRAARIILDVFSEEAKHMDQELSEKKSIHNSIAHSELGAMDDLDLPPEVEAGFKEAEEHRQLLIDNNIIADESTSHMSSTELCIYHGLIEDKALKEFMASCVAPVDLDPDEVAKDW